MKKTISFILSLVLAFSFITSIVPATFSAESAVTSTDNLFVNPGFENGLEGWQLHIGNSGASMDASVVETEKNSGSYSLNRKLTSQINNQTIVQTVTLEPNTTYDISFFVKGATQYARYYFTSNVEVPYDTTNALGLQQIAIPNYPNWHRIAFTFTTTDATVYSFCAKLQSGNTNCYYDDFCLTKADNSNLVADSSFENNILAEIYDGGRISGIDTTAGWSRSNMIRIRDNITSYKIRTNNKSLSAVKPGWIFTDINVKPETTYEISTYVYGKYSTWGVAVQNLTYIEGQEGYDAASYTFASNEYQRYGTTKNEAVNRYGQMSYTPSNSEWVKTTSKFTTYANQTKARVFIYIASEYDNGLYVSNDLFIDDFAVKETDNLVVNPGYEDGIDNWRRWGSPDYEIKTDSVNSGEKSIYHFRSSQKYDSVIFQDISMLPYTDYSVSFWVKGHTGWGCAYVCDNIMSITDRNNAEGHILSKYTFDGTKVPAEYEEWTKVTFTVSTTDVVENRLAFFFASPSTGLYIDDVEVKALGKVGDFDRDGVRGSSDLVVLRRYLLGFDADVDNVSFLDVKKDNEVNIVDLIRLKKWVADKV